MSFTSRESNGSGTFALGLLFGAAVGTVVGLCLAPKPGAKLRRDVMKSVDGLKRSAMDAYDDAREAASDLASRGADAAERTMDAADKVIARARSIKRHAEDA